MRQVHTNICCIVLTYICCIIFLYIPTKLLHDFGFNPMLESNTESCRQSNKNGAHKLALENLQKVFESLIVDFLIFNISLPCLWVSACSFFPHQLLEIFAKKSLSKVCIHMMNTKQSVCIADNKPCRIIFTLVHANHV